MVPLFLHKDLRQVPPKIFEKTADYEIFDRYAPGPTDPEIERVVGKINKGKDLLKKHDMKKAKIKSNAKAELIKEGLIKSTKRGLHWTRDGKKAMLHIMMEDKEEALEKGGPWPPYPMYFRDFRRLIEE
jgi:hypothetical protein